MVDLKLDIIEQYGSAYTKAFSGKGGHGSKSITSTDSAARACMSRSAPGQQSRAVRRARSRSRRRSTNSTFIDLDKDKTDYLRTRARGDSNVSIVNDDANVYLRELLPTIQLQAL